MQVTKSTGLENLLNRTIKNSFSSKNSSCFPDMKEEACKTFDLRSHNNWELSSEGVQNQTFDLNTNQIVSEGSCKERTLISVRDFDEMIKSRQGLGSKKNSGEPEEIGPTRPKSSYADYASHCGVSVRFVTPDLGLFGLRIKGKPTSKLITSYI